METNEKLMSAIFNVGRQIREEICKSNCLADFTQTEIEILKFLQGKKNTTMKTIADYLHIKPSSATPIIDNLVKKNSLKRVQKEGDRRMVYIELTQKGLKSLEKRYKSIHKTIGKIFGKLDHKDKETLINIFERINNNENI